MPQEEWLSELHAELEREEERHLAPSACPSREAVRRTLEQRQDHRQAFAVDCDRILHSHAYTRYIDKTQVFSLVENDHITHRVLHVQMVSRIARTIGRFLALNEDLIEAIALGHDLGHPPFGHEGEKILALLCREHDLPGFAHNVQSVQFLDRFERKGQGWNLCLQVLDGICFHDGESFTTRLRPQREKDFAALDMMLSGKELAPGDKKIPMTLEGCVVRLADTIAYIGRDIEDAIELKLIERSQLPQDCVRKLGASNGRIVYTLVTDVIRASRRVRHARPGTEGDCICHSREVSESLALLKKFNYEWIYCNPAFKPDFALIQQCYRELFAYFLEKMMEKEMLPDGEVGMRTSRMAKAYRDSHAPAAVVRDYLSGMTDDFFLHQAKMIGCVIPEKICLPD